MGPSGRGQTSEDMTGSAIDTDTSNIPRELITGSVVIAAIVMFIWTGGSAMTAVVRYLTGVGPNVQEILLTALLLNIALIMFGWRRYRDLQVEVARRRDAEERARALAETDPLTGFLNRRSMTEKISALLEEAKSVGQPVAILMLDLDNFKQVNDVHGHAAGDYVLLTIARRIRETVPPEALTARLGGDEFACAFMFDPSSRDSVTRIAQRLVTAMNEPMDLDDLHLTVSTSIGIARSDADCSSMEALMRRGDIAMYAAKKHGRNTYVWFDASMERELSERSKMETDIRHGIVHGEFLPYYEPQIELSTGRLIGFEMLARWQRPDHGLVSPELFIPIAEESGHIGDLSLAVIRRAFEETRDWDPALTLSINISPAQLKDPWLSQKIRKLLVETGFPAGRLELEITEGALFENLSLAQAIVSSLKNQGIRIALDDFGSGYGSLAHLRALPLDRIKINRDFVSSINHSSESAAIVTTIINLAESLHLGVTAEGIENARIESRLRELGCNEGQGWHFGKPMPVDQARELVRQKGLLLTLIGDDPEDEAPAAQPEDSSEGSNADAVRKAV